MKASTAQVPNAFARFFAEHREHVRGQLTRLVPASEVDDVMQEVFVKAARALPKFRGQATLRTWLHQIAHRTALDHLRSRHHNERQRTVALTREPDDDACGGDCAAAAISRSPADAPGQLVRAEMHACIREFIARLPPQHAEVLALKDLDGLTNAEIAKRLGLSLDATKIRLHRARTVMRGLLDRGCELYHTPENTLACDRIARRRLK